MAQKIKVNTSLVGNQLHAVCPTYQGMAHFAGSGPHGRTCRECEHWQATHLWIKRKGFGNVPEPRDAYCRAYARAAMRQGPAVPHDAQACRYFEEADRPQALAKPASKWEQA